MTHLITLSGKVDKLESVPSVGFDHVSVKGLGVLFMPLGTADILNLGDEIEVEVHFEKADNDTVTVDTVDDIPEEALQ